MNGLPAGVKLFTKFTRFLCRAANRILVTCGGPEDSSNKLRLYSHF